MTTKKQDKIHRNVIIMSDSENSDLSPNIIGLSYLSIVCETSSKSNNLCIILTDRLKGLDFEEVWFQ